MGSATIQVPGPAEFLDKLKTIVYSIEKKLIFGSAELGIALPIPRSPVPGVVHIDRSKSDNFFQNRPGAPRHTKASGTLRPAARRWPSTVRPDELRRLATITLDSKYHGEHAGGIERRSREDSGKLIIKGAGLGRF